MKPRLKSSDGGYGLSCRIGTEKRSYNINYASTCTLHCLQQKILQNKKYRILQCTLNKYSSNRINNNPIPSIFRDHHSNVI